MKFAFNPDGGPARLIRYVEPRELPRPDLVATLDEKSNLLRINKELFRQLPSAEQQILLRTHSAWTSTRDYPDTFGPFETEEAA
jgi:hypothetical protein